MLVVPGRRRRRPSRLELIWFSLLAPLATGQDTASLHRSVISVLWRQASYVTDIDIAGDKQSHTSLPRRPSCFTAARPILAMGSPTPQPPIQRTPSYYPSLPDSPDPPQLQSSLLTPPTRPHTHGTLSHPFPPPTGDGTYSRSVAMPLRNLSRRVGIPLGTCLSTLPPILGPARDKPVDGEISRLGGYTILQLEEGERSTLLVDYGMTGLVYRTPRHTFSTQPTVSRHLHPFPERHITTPLRYY